MFPTCSEEQSIFLHLHRVDNVQSAADIFYCISDNLQVGRAIYNACMLLISQSTVIHTNCKSFQQYSNIIAILTTVDGFIFEVPMFMD